MDYADLTGVEKAAVLALALPEGDARALLGRLSEEEIECILSAASRLEEVPGAISERVVAEFRNAASRRRRSVVGGRARARGLARGSLEGAAGEALAHRLGRDETRIDRRLARFAPGFIARTLAGEHPQTIALVVSQLPAERAAFVVGALPETLGADVVLRVATLEDVSHEVLAELEESVAELFDAGGGPPTRVGGVESAARLMAHVPRSSANAILESVDGCNPLLAEEIRRRMLRFDDLQRLDRRGFQLLLQEIPIEDLVLALKAASETMREKVFENVSLRAAEQIRDETELLGPVRTSEVERVQVRIVDIARRLEEEGRIDLDAETEDDVPV